MKLMDDGVNPLIVNLLAYWYSNQSAEVRWQSAVSAKFGIGNGVRQGGVLSPYLFTRYTLCSEKNTHSHFLPYLHE